MPTMKTMQEFRTGLTAMAALAGLALGGCASPGPTPQAPPSKGAAQVWAQNCNRCHNIRPAAEFSDAQWDVIMHHMRVRANLTAEEHQQILTLMKASN
jgi:hypothetical protein